MWRNSVCNAMQTKLATKLATKPDHNKTKLDWTELNYTVSILTWTLNPELYSKVGPVLRHGDRHVTVKGGLVAWKRPGSQIQTRVCLLLQYLLQSCSRGGRGIVEDMCYERRRTEALVDLSAHHALANAGGIGLALWWNNNKRENIHCLLLRRRKIFF